MTTRKARPVDLREACVAEALAIIAEKGVEALSLRDVARRLGVSHQAPYKHFPSRDHILAEVVSRAFVRFAQHLDACPRSADLRINLLAVGSAYLDFARQNPLQYRLMFGTPLPDPQAHPDMMQASRHAFGLLLECLSPLMASQPGHRPENLPLDAMFVWATVHGLASIMQTSAMSSLGLPDHAVAHTPAHVLTRIGQALKAASPTLETALAKEPSP